MPTAEQKVVAYVKENILFFAAFLFVIISLIIRMSGMNYESSDYNQFLKPWFYQIKSEGGFSSLKHAVGDYNVPYMFILTVLTYLPVKPLVSIKFVSVIFDYGCALATTAIVFHLLGKVKSAIFPSLVAFGIVLFLPTVLLNSAFWCQSDSIYTVFVLLCILYLIKENYILAFVFFSIALTFKLQAVFIVSISPALIAGRPFIDTIKIYGNQVGEYPSLFVNYCGFYALFKGEYNDFMIFSILLTVAILGIMTFAIIYKKYDVSKSNIISLGIWIIYICIFFLPSMHERYGFIIDILSVIYFAVKSKKIYIPIVINLTSLISYCEFLFGKPILNDSYLALANLIVIVILTFDVLTDLKCDTQQKDLVQSVVVSEISCTDDKEKCKI